jgi:GNAT superfamily N-acetyltransferase
MVGWNLTDGELFVSPNHQGKGIGTKLIEHMFSVAQEKHKAISWDTFTHRVYEHPLKWYKSLGFEEISHWVMITGDIKKILENIDNKK